MIRPKNICGASITVLLVFWMFNTDMKAQTISAMTYNIRMDNPGDGENQWAYRKAELLGLLSRYHADFIGLQEVMNHQFAYIDSLLPNYACFGPGRDDGKNLGERTPILYDSLNYTLISQSTFWLSETPNKVSRGWDAACNRTCTYGHFQHKKSKRKVWVFNTHFDHIGIKARENSAELILSKINELCTSDAPIILMGDLNATPEMHPIKIFTSLFSDAFTTSAKKQKGPIGTWNGFDTTIQVNRRIDYIFVDGLILKHLHHIDDKRDNELWVSDHLPVLLKAKYNSLKN